MTEPAELPLVPDDGYTDSAISRAAALFQLAEDATVELDKWKDETIREELAHVSATLDAAAIASLDASEVYGWAWTKAGAAFILEYKNRRELIEQLGPAPDVVSKLCLGLPLTDTGLRSRLRKDGADRKPMHHLCADCACYCHSKGQTS